MFRPPFWAEARGVQPGQSQSRVEGSSGEVLGKRRVLHRAAHHRDCRQLKAHETKTGYRHFWEDEGFPRIQMDESNVPLATPAVPATMQLIIRLLAAYHYVSVLN